MSGKKISKSTSNLTLAEKMVKAFKAAPTTINKQFRKEIAVLKRETSKLKAIWLNAKTAEKSSKTKLAALTEKNKTKNSSSSRKQLLAGKKAHAKLSKTVAAIASEIATAQKKITTLMENQNTFSALAKLINQAPKVNKTPKKAKAQKKQSVKKGKSITSPSKEHLDTITESPVSEISQETSEEVTA